MGLGAGNIIQKAGWCALGPPSWQWDQANGDNQSEANTAGPESMAGFPPAPVTLD